MVMDQLQPKEKSMDMTKSFSILKKLVWEAYKVVKSNKGAAGVDEETLTDFDHKLKDNLYIPWNPMSSGSYFPRAVRAVPIPKKAGGTRILSVPTVTDRIAQATVKRVLEPLLEPHFHKDSFRDGEMIKDMKSKKVI